jgi:hypothetical protein
MPQNATFAQILALLYQIIWLSLFSKLGELPTPAKLLRQHKNVILLLKSVFRCIKIILR